MIYFRGLYVLKSNLCLSGYSKGTSAFRFYWWGNAACVWKANQSNRIWRGIYTCFITIIYNNHYQWPWCFYFFRQKQKMHMVIHAFFGVNILYFCDTLAFYYCKTVSLPYFANVNIFHFFLYYPVHMQCQLIICKP